MSHDAASAPRRHLLPVVYDGPDLEPLAERLGLSVEALVEVHQAGQYRALQLGFLPGFAYLGPVPERLHVPRLPAPRPRVPARSVGLAAGFTGVYPLASPGGWHLLGRMVGPPLFDPHAAHPSLLHVGDEVRFEAVSEAEAHVGPPGAPQTCDAEGIVGAGVIVVQVVGLVTVQDGVRRAFASDGVPEGGPFDHDALRAANVAVGNPPDTAALEIARGRLTIEAFGRPMGVSVNGGSAVRMGIGERRTIDAREAPRVVAIEGGVDVPLLLGSRGTCLPGAFGGHQGRALRGGDRLAIGEAWGEESPRAWQEVKMLDQVALPIAPAPMDDEGEALRVLLASSYRLAAQSNRVGQRLSGPPLPRRLGGELAPRPMVRGAIQVTHDGTPVVLGPDHPTTGGYPVVGHLDETAVAALGRLRVGGGIRFVKRKGA